MNQVIQEIKNTINGLRSGTVKETPSPASISWFSKKVQNIKNISKGGINPQQDKTKKTIINDYLATKSFKYKKSGYIYFFNYLPPNAKELPFYDRFPLVLSLGFEGSKLIGVNLHYLPPRIRLYVVYKIMKSLSTNTKEGVRIKINSILSSRVIRKYIMILGEQYDMRGIRSKIKLVAPEEFVVMSFLPMQKFAKKQQPQVIQHINKIFRGIK
jgi:hypothetical protein